MAPDSYRFTIMSLEGGEIESWAGAKVTSEVAVPDGIDTLVIVGDAGMANREVSSETINFIPEVGETTLSAYNHVIQSIAKQIVDMMEQPWYNDQDVE